MKKGKVKDIWSITFLEIAASHRTTTIIHVKAETPAKALSFFNEEIADGDWVRKAKIEDVEQFEVYEEEKEGNKDNELHRFASFLCEYYITQVDGYLQIHLCNEPGGLEDPVGWKKCTVKDCPKLRSQEESKK